MKQTKEFFITRVDKETAIKTTDIVVTEYPFTITLNGEEIATLLCSPKSLEYLVYGFLSSAGFIKDKDDITSLEINEEKGIATVMAKEDFHKAAGKDNKSAIKGSSGGTVLDYKQNSINFISNKMIIHSQSIISLMDNFMSKSRLFLNTGGVHSAALCNNNEIILFHEDIGRHNALDKVIGEAIVKGIDFTDKLVLTSGRVSSEMLLKTARQGIAVLISHSAAMDLALEMGIEFNMTIIGFARGKRYNIYSGEERIKFDC